MALKPRGAVGKPSNKRPGRPSSGGSSSATKSKKSSSLPKPRPVEQKSKPQLADKKKKKKPPHLRYSEKELQVPRLNGILPAGVQKPRNAKKGKTFVDDKESMNTILALVMAEKEGNIESKMMRSRQLEEVREARRIEAEKRAQSKKAGLEERKRDIKDEKRQRKRGPSDAVDSNTNSESPVGAKKNLKKRVSFG